MLANELARYATPEMSRVWSADWKLRRWVEIEIAAARAQGAPEEALKEMGWASTPRPADVAAEEQRTHHDVIAFLNVWRHDMAPTGRSWTHRGLTSSDVVDTANAMRMKASAEVVQSSLTNLIRCVGQMALDHRYSVRVGRTHGQTAEVITWGWRMAEFTYAIDRARRRLAVLAPFFAVGKLSGPVGDFKRTSYAVERAAMWDLGLAQPGAASQVVMRDAYVDYVHALAQAATVVEAIALEVRLSSRTDTGEVAEGFAVTQRGSSAMPHKRNPIKAEQLCGLARLVRAQVEPVAQGVATHHERDISHSSVERVALQTASVITDYMVTTCTRLMSDLVVNTDAMRRRVTESPELLSAMIKDRLVEQGWDPQAAYEVVYRGFRCWDNGRSENHATLVEALEEPWSDGMWSDPVPEVPDFASLVKMLDRPEDLLGNTDHVYDEIGTMVGPGSGDDGIGCPPGCTSPFCDCPGTD